MLLRRRLWRFGLRYRIHDKNLPGRPDVVFRRERIVVFCDGDFWHGRNWSERESRLRTGANAPYWLAKILANRERDVTQTAELQRQGWTVLRLWETDILKNPEQAANYILSAVRGSGD
jgi:DNA mismatch endonuclease, patch repair protein